MPSAWVTGVKERRVRGLEIVEVALRDDAGRPFAAKWIGRNRYVYGRFREGMRLFVRGRVERNLTGPVVNVAQYACSARTSNIAASWCRFTARAKIWPPARSRGW